ncbi:hypothetical protein OIU74_011770, partial [Salix koriyanagi]
MVMVVVVVVVVVGAEQVRMVMVAAGTRDGGGGTRGGELSVQTMIWMKVPLVTGSLLGFCNFLYYFGWRDYLMK